MEDIVVHLVRGSKAGIVFNNSGPASVIPLPEVLSDVTLLRMKEYITAAFAQPLSGFPSAKTLTFKDYAEGTNL